MRYSIPELKNMLQAMISTSLKHAKEHPDQDILPNAMALTDAVARMFEEDRQAHLLELKDEAHDTPR